MVAARIVRYRRQVPVEQQPAMRGLPVQMHLHISRVAPENVNLVVHRQRAVRSDKGFDEQSARHIAISPFVEPAAIALGHPPRGRGAKLLPIHLRISAERALIAAMAGF